MPPEMRPLVSGGIFSRRVPTIPAVCRVRRSTIRNRRLDGRPGTRLAQESSRNERRSMRSTVVRRPEMNGNEYDSPCRTPLIDEDW